MTADNALGLINTFLSGLDERECNIFLRRYYFFEDSKTIAARLGMSGSNARTSLFRIRKKLKDYLRRCNNE
jgi:RNA polymerase sigma-70 factor (ECF subfamily)